MQNEACDKYPHGCSCPSSCFCKSVAPITHLDASISSMNSFVVSAIVSTGAVEKRSLSVSNVV
jgi:hypothetical protein